VEVLLESSGSLDGTVLRLCGHHHRRFVISVFKDSILEARAKTRLLCYQGEDLITFRNSQDQAKSSRNYNSMKMTSEFAKNIGYILCKL